MKKLIIFTILFILSSIAVIATPNVIKDNMGEFEFISYEEKNEVYGNLVLEGVAKYLLNEDKCRINFFNFQDESLLAEYYSEEMENLDIEGEETTKRFVSDAGVEWTSQGHIIAIEVDTTWSSQNPLTYSCNGLADEYLIDNPSDLDDILLLIETMHSSEEQENLISNNEDAFDDEENIEGVNGVWVKISTKKQVDTSESEISKVGDLKEEATGLEVEVQDEIESVEDENDPEIIKLEEGETMQTKGRDGPPEFIKVWIPVPEEVFEMDLNEVYQYYNTDVDSVKEDSLVFEVLKFIDDSSVDLDEESNELTESDAHVEILNKDSKEDEMIVVDNIIKKDGEAIEEDDIEMKDEFQPIPQRKEVENQNLFTKVRKFFGRLF